MNNERRNDTGQFSYQANLPEIVGRPVRNYNIDYYEAVDSEQYEGSSLAIVIGLFRKVLRHKWLMALCFFTAISISVAYAFMATPIFRSRADMEIEEESRKTVDPGISIRTGSEKDYFATQASILKGRALVQELVTRTHLEESPEFNRKPGIISRWLKGLRSYFGAKESSSTEQKTDKTVREVMSRMSVDNPPKSRVVSLTMDATDPKLAAEMLGNLINIYMEQNLRKRRAESLDASLWLKKQLVEIQTELAKSQHALVAFTTKHGFVSLDKDLNHIVAGFVSAANERVKAVEGRLKAEAYKDHLTPGTVWRARPHNSEPDPLSKMKELLAQNEAEYVSLRTVYSNNYPKVKIQKAKIERLRAKIKELEDQNAQDAVKKAAKEEALFQENFVKARKSAMELNSLGVQYAILKKEVDASQQIYQMYLKKSKEMEVAAGVIGNNVSLLLPPVIPSEPVEPKKMIILLVGGLLGLAAGVLIILVREETDKSIKTEEELQTYLQVPSLGAIPDFDRLGGSDKGSSPSGHQLTPYNLEETIMYDALRNVHTSISLSSRSDSQIVAVSSAEPEEGKTFVSAYLATSICDDGMSVLLIDCDLRRPRIHQAFRTCHNNPGLSNYLRGQAQLQDIVQKSFSPNLRIITSGPPSPNPVGLLRSSRMEQLLNGLKASYELIILDTPPILSLSDTRVLAARTEGVVLVVKYGSTSRDLLAKAIDSIIQSRGNVLGVILNRSDPHSQAKRYKYYQSGYSGGYTT
jgi:succinoglycan biosynthesis transport protein ExoP